MLLKYVLSYNTKNKLNLEHSPVPQFPFSGGRLQSVQLLITENHFERKYHQFCNDGEEIDKFQKHKHDAPNLKRNQY